MILIDGEPGIGKSRLLLELMERAVASSSPVVDLRRSPRHANSVLYPVVDLLQRITSRGLSRVATRLQWPGVDAA